MIRNIFLLLVLGLVLAACTLGATGPTGDTATDPAAAQNMLPNLSGYTSTNADSISDAITSVGGSASLITGNALVAAAIARIDSMIQCYQNVGAAAARVYTQGDITSVVSGQVPRIGAVAVVNQDRISRNFLNCTIGSAEGLSAQGAEVQPCGGSGSKTVRGETIHYVYAGTAPEFCQTVQAHFDSLN
ncbi:MAG: hypothetical protein K8I30_01625 [Anaerolineae bacterium]|nr:hypothetical protein [Anaerolineae bacterium]